MGRLFTLVAACARVLRQTGNRARKAGILGAVVVSGVALVGAVSVAPASAMAVGSATGEVMSAAAQVTGRAQAAGSSAQCFKASFPDCSSTDPDVTFSEVSSGDTTGCEFQSDIDWGDHTSNVYNYAGASDGTRLVRFTHQYTTPGTYTIVNDSETTVGSCFSGGDYTLEFTLLGSSSPSCDSSYLTVVTDNAGYAVAALPELFTDKVTVTWCTGRGGAYVRIVSASQHPSVEPAGFSVAGAEIRALQFAGIGFSVTPATGPTPFIVNGAYSAAATASGLSFTGDLNLGADLVDWISDTLSGEFIVKGLVEELVPLIRHGDLGRASKVLLSGWNKLAAAFRSWATSFGLPAVLAASVRKDLPVEKIVEAMVDLAGTFVSLATQQLAALNSNVTAQDVIDAVKHAIQQMADGLDFKWTAWAPQITVKLGPAAIVDASVSGETDLAITVEDPTWTTTP
jgi:hypothetical protein